MKILYVASEGNPFCASGGLGDVIGALPKTVAQISSGDEVSVVLPLYGKMKEEYRARLVKVCDFSFKLSWRSTGASAFVLEEGGVKYYFLENHYYFNRDNLYGEADDGERFAFYSMAVCEFMLKSGLVPDVLHANDWQTALTVIYLKTLYASNPTLSGIRTVYTIHNIEYQGKFDPFILGDVFSLDEKYRGVVEYDGCINLMKGALVSSDFITTVSPNYARELGYDFYAFGLQQVISSVSHKMDGVINGIDYGYFSPDKGGDIDFKYYKRTVKSGKAKNKAALQASLGLEVSADTPLVVMITRLATQKGIDLLLCIADELLCRNLQLVVLGTGEKEYEKALSELESRHANCKALLKFDRVISKKLYASADIFLMPSKFEPCGLAQMICCSYGTIPVVRATGGLYDTIIPYGMENSNGFNFSNYNAHEFLGAIDRALEVYADPKEWNLLVKRAVACDFTWDRSAQKYLSIYNNLLNW